MQVSCIAVVFNFRMLLTRSCYGHVRDFSTDPAIPLFIASRRMKSSRATSLPSNNYYNEKTYRSGDPTHPNNGSVSDADESSQNRTDNANRPDIYYSNNINTLILYIAKIHFASSRSVLNSNLASNDFATWNFFFTTRLAGHPQQTVSASIVVPGAKSACSNSMLLDRITAPEETSEPLRTAQLIIALGEC